MSEAFVPTREGGNEYKAFVGILQQTLAINDQHVAFGSKKYPIETITRIRWGGTSQSYYGINTGTAFLIAFGDRISEAVVATRNREVYEEFTERLWRSVGSRLLLETLKAVVYGGSVEMAGVAFDDEGIKLKRPNLLFGHKTGKFRWSEVRASSYEGNFIVSTNGPSKFWVSASYSKAPNVPVLAILVGMAIDRKVEKLSQLWSDSE